MEWKEISKETYREMFEVLPPIWFAGGFFPDEPVSGNFYDFFIEKDGRFYQSYFELGGHSAQEVKESLEAFCKRRGGE